MCYLKEALPIDVKNSDFDTFESALYMNSGEYTFNFSYLFSGRAENSILNYV